MSLDAVRAAAAAGRRPLPRIPTVLHRCACRVWPMAAMLGRGRCGRCGTGTEYAGPDPDSPKDTP